MAHGTYMRTHTDSIDIPISSVLVSIESLRLPEKWIIIWKIMEGISEVKHLFHLFQANIKVFINSVLKVTVTIVP